MAARIIFVGLYNKLGFKPLDSQSNTGKVVDRIMDKLPMTRHIVKSNLYNTYDIPDPAQKRELLAYFVDTIKPAAGDIFVLLGHMVHTDFPEGIPNKICIAHPANKRSQKETDEYVDKAVLLINKYFKN